ADSEELAYARQRFFLECKAAGVQPIDCPFTLNDHDAFIRDLRQSASWGYRAKSCVAAEHVETVRKAYLPSEAELIGAREIVDAYELAQSRGQSRVQVGEHLIETPTYRHALSLLQQAK